MLRGHQLASIAILASLILSGCAGSRDSDQAEAYNAFAIRAAEAELWNEAVFRLKQVINVDPVNSKAYNNLGVAYEALGNIDEAVAAYEHATELEPDNKYYRLNYRRCRIHVRRSGADADTAQLAEEGAPPKKKEQNSIFETRFQVKTEICK